MTPIPIFCPHTSSRLAYVLDWIFNEQLKTGYTLVASEAELSNCPGYISYGKPDGSISIPAVSLLSEDIIEAHPVKVGDWSGLPTLYSFPAQGYTLPFDIFSAIFYLISRYEEYLPFTADKHSRYPATESILYRNNLLERPIVDEWLTALRHVLAPHFDIPAPTPFSFKPTYDIDIAYSYKNKGVVRTVGALAKDLLRGRINNLKARVQSLSGASDPYDSFSWLREVHELYGYKPVYFILSALKTTAYDKNISPFNPGMKILTRSLYDEGIVGIHPSYYSNRKPELLSAEKRALIKVIRNPVIVSRQHYIKNKIPYTYNLLLTNNISSDYSMGYATHIGFRAGTSQSFMWYNLKKEKVTKLRVYPFCFMDTMCKYELGMSAEEAFEKLYSITDKLQKVNGLLVTVFHNFSLGTSNEWEPEWKELYEAFLKKMSTTS